MESTIISKGAVDRGEHPGDLRDREPDLGDRAQPLARPDEGIGLEDHGGCKVVRFEIAGGRFGLIASINFRRSIVFVKFIGTLADYDRIDALTVDDFR
jgi:hypothetical protein